LQPPQSAKIGRAECHLLEGLFAKKVTLLWISKDAFLILKTKQYSIQVKRKFSQTISYTPKINVKIPGKLLGKHVEGEWEKNKDVTSQENQTKVPVSEGQ